jgi:hypothetical protein
MTKFLIPLVLPGKENNTEEVDVYAVFSHYVDNLQYWFAIHHRQSDEDALILAAYRSGAKLTDIKFGAFKVGRANLSKKEAIKWCKTWIDIKNAALPAGRMREIMNSAQVLNPNKP